MWGEVDTDCRLLGGDVGVCVSVVSSGCVEKFPDCVCGVYLLL